MSNWQGFCSLVVMVVIFTGAHFQIEQRNDKNFELNSVPSLSLTVFRPCQVSSFMPSYNLCYINGRAVIFKTREKAQYYEKKDRRTSPPRNFGSNAKGFWRTKYFTYLFIERQTLVSPSRVTDTRSLAELFQSHPAATCSVIVSGNSKMQYPCKQVEGSSWVLTHRAHRIIKGGKTSKII